MPSWIKEKPAKWDAQKSTIIGGAPEGSLHIDDYEEGDLLSGEWWRVEDDGEIVGYGWMDLTWGEGEILLAVHPDKQGKGIGTFIIDHLAQEASQHGLTYLYNVVLPSHPEHDKVAAWLKSRKFEASHDDDRLIRKLGDGS